MSASSKARIKPNENARNVYTMVFLAAVVRTTGNMSAAISGLKKEVPIFSQSAKTANAATTRIITPYNV